MMHRIKNGEPVFYTQECSQEQKGKIMSSKDLHDFAVEILIKEYTETNATVIRHNKQYDNEADFCFINFRGKSSHVAEKTVNVLVVYCDTFTNDISGIDTSWMVDEYYRTGAIPRVTFASAWCVNDDTKDGKPAVYGGDFCFKYYSVSLLPNESNTHLEKDLSAIELAKKYAESWRQLDSSIVAPYLDKGFHYSSDWVFDEIPSRSEYLYYFKRKLEAIKRTESHIDFFIGRDRQTGDVAVILAQNCEYSALCLTTKKGYITSACMKEYDSKYKLFDPDDEIFQSHGDHIDTIAPSQEFLKNYLNQILEESEVWRKCRAEVTTEDMSEEPTDVYSLRYSNGDISFLSTIITSPKLKANIMMSVYPIIKGKPIEVCINKVIEWDNQIEATVLCSIGEFDFAFFASDYYCNKESYIIGNTITIDVAALAYNIEEAPRSFSFEGQKAVDWLAKIGRDTQYDEKGNIKPVIFNLEKLVSFINRDSKCPDDAEFQSPAGKIESTSFLDIDFYKTDISICQRETDEGELNVSIPLYFRQDFFPEVKQYDPIRGWIWLSGTITGKHNKEEYQSHKTTLAETCTIFEEFMDGCDFSKFSNLMNILPQLPTIKIENGYKFDAFKCGDNMGWRIVPYVCQISASAEWEPQIIEETGEVLTPYNDSLRIQGMHSWQESKCIPPILQYFNVPFSEEGIMQAWLLNNIEDFMPKGWHSNYGQKYFVFNKKVFYYLFPDTISKTNILESCLQKDRMKVKSRLLSIDINSLLPTIKINGDSAILEYAYWNDWSGLNKIKQPVKRVGNTVEFGEAQKEILISFCCSLNF